MVKITTILFIVISSFRLDASELRGPEAGVIPYGMGRAYSAVADDWLALHYNPAGLAQVRTVELQAFDLKLGANSQVVNSSDLVKSMSDNATTSVEKANKLIGKKIYAQVNNTSQLTIPNFAIGVIYDIQANVDLQNKQYPYTDLRYVKDIGLITGTGWGFGRKKELRIGLALKFIKRKGGTSRVDIDDISSVQSSLLSRFAATGSAVGFTPGIQHTVFLKNRAEINTSLVWHDVGNTSFGDNTQSSRPEQIEQNLIAGAEFRLAIGGKVDRRKARRYGQERSPHHLSFAFDYSHLNKSINKVQLARHLHYGLNLDLPIISIQAGANQNQFCFGTAIEFFGLRVAASSYAEEMGSYAGQKPDRRYLLSIGGILGLGKF